MVSMCTSSLRPTRERNREAAGDGLGDLRMRPPRGGKLFASFN